MPELEEITFGKSLEQLRVELKFQIEKLGESLGGTICSYIAREIVLLEDREPN